MNEYVPLSVIEELKALPIPNSQLPLLTTISADISKTLFIS